MSVNPAGTLLLIDSPVIGSTVTVVVDSLDIQLAIEPFDRLEFSNEKLKSARTLCGESRLLGENLGRKPFQIVFDCMSDVSAVPLGPDSDANFYRIKKKWVIRRYQIKGAMSTAQDTNNLFIIAQNHQDLLSQFQYYQARVSGDCPYASLIAFQSQDFSYLVPTNVNPSGGTQTSASGSCMDIAQSGVILTQFSESTELAIAQNSGGSSYEYYKIYNLTFETRMLAGLDDITSDFSASGTFYPS